MQQEASSQSPQVSFDPFVEEMTNVEFRDAFQVLSQAMMTQFNRELVVPINLNVGMTTSKVRDFTRMDSPEFMVSKSRKILKS